MSFLPRNSRRRFSVLFYRYMGVTGFDLGLTMSRPHAGEAWLAPLSIQAQINANQKDERIADLAEAIANGVQPVAQPELVGMPS